MNKNFFQFSKAFFVALDGGVSLLRAREELKLFAVFKRLNNYFKRPFIVWGYSSLGFFCSTLV